MKTHNFRKAEIASWSVEGVLGYPGSRMWTHDSVAIIWLLQGPYIVGNSPDGWVNKAVFHGSICAPTRRFVISPF